MGILKFYSVNLNNHILVRTILGAFQAQLKSAKVYFTLQHILPYYFSTPGHTLISDPGWYIILEDKTPIYVGEAQNLNGRLNTTTGSCDDFGRRARTSDSQRNFIKKLSEAKLLSPLRVAVLSQPSLITEASLCASTFTKMDRKNIEKLLNIHRGKLEYL